MSDDPKQRRRLAKQLRLEPAFAPHDARMTTQRGTSASDRMVLRSPRLHYRPKKVGFATERLRLDRDWMRANASHASNQERGLAPQGPPALRRSEAPPPEEPKRSGGVRRDLPGIPPPKRNEFGEYYFDRIIDRSRFYGRMGFLLRSRGVDSVWFDAAALVTNETGVGAADNLNLWFMNDLTEDFLRNGNMYLTKFNVEDFAGPLMRGEEIRGAEGLRGRARDYRMVEIEQAHVSDFVNRYMAGRSAEERAAIARQINAGFTDFKFPVASGLGAAMRHPALEYALDRVRAAKGADFDFMNESERVALGKAVIDYLRR